ncbi:MAG: hypothetical protein ABFS16_06555 [Bacteroidota bacterium]
MKTSKLSKFTWVLFALTLATTTLFAQNRRNANQVNQVNNQTQNRSCVEYISGLTDYQKTKITGLEKKHQEEIVKLREQRRTTADAQAKDEIKVEIDKKVEAHRTAVKQLLNEDQQKQYDQLQASGPYNKNRNTVAKRGQGKGNGTGNGRGSGRGRGQGRGNRF